MLNEIAYFYSLTKDLQDGLISNQIDQSRIRRFSTTYLMSSGKSLDRAFYPLKIIGRFFYHQNLGLTTLDKAYAARDAILNWMSIDQENLKQFLEDALVKVQNNKVAINLVRNLQTELQRLNTLPNFPFFIDSHKRITSLIDLHSKHGLYPAIVLKRIGFFISETEQNPQKIITWLSAFESWLKDLPNYLLNPFNLTFGNNNAHQLNHHPNNLEIIINQVIQEGPLKAYRLRITNDSIIELLKLTNYRGNQFSENEFRILLFIAAYYKVMRTRDQALPKLLVMPQVDICAWLNNQKIFENTKPDAKGQGNDPLWYFANYYVKNVGPLVSKLKFYPEKTHYGFDDQLTQNLNLEEVKDDIKEGVPLKVDNGIVYFSSTYDDFNQEFDNSSIKKAKKAKNILKNAINEKIKILGKLVKNN